MTWLVYGAVAWCALGFLSYAYWELRRRNWVEARYRSAAHQPRWAPDIGPGLFLALFGPLVFVLGLLTIGRRPAVSPRSGEAAATREHPIIAADLEAEVPLEEALEAGERAAARPRVVGRGR